jgi:iron complex transport system substrate-binding protein
VNVLSTSPRTQTPRRHRCAWILSIAAFAACTRHGAQTPAPTQDVHRIVALTIGSVDTLAMLGELGRAIAVEADCHAPGTENLVKIRNDDHSGPSQALNIEAVLALNPDLVIAKEDLRPALSGRGLSVLWIPTASDLETIVQTVATIGERIGQGDKAHELVATMRAQVADIERTVRPLSRVRVYYEAGRPGRTCGKGTVMDDMIRLAGGINIAADVSLANPTLSSEAILARDPEVIVLSPWSDAAAILAARPGWQHIAAVRNGRIHQLPEAKRDLQSPSPRCVEACASQLVPWLHPELAQPAGHDK